MTRYAVRILLHVPFPPFSESVTVPCESEAQMKRLAAHLGEAWAGSESVRLTPYGPLPETTIIHAQGEHGMISFEANTIRRIEPVTLPEADRRVDANPYSSPLFTRIFNDYDKDDDEYAIPRYFQWPAPSQDRGGDEEKERGARQAAPRTPRGRLPRVHGLWAAALRRVKRALRLRERTSH